MCSCFILGNILLLEKEGAEDDVLIIDYEYSSYNYRFVNFMKTDYYMLSTMPGSSVIVLL